MKYTSPKAEFLKIGNVDVITASEPDIGIELPSDPLTSKIDENMINTDSFEGKAE